MAKAATKERDIEVDRDPDEAAQAAADKALDKEIDAAVADDGPDNAAARREQEREAAKVRDGAPSDPEDDQDARLAYDLEGDYGDAAPQERDSRRKRRNRVRREAQQQSAAEIVALNQRVMQLSGMIDQMSKGQVGLAAGGLDEQIRSMQERLQGIDDAMARAVKEQDEDTYRRGLRLRDEARDRLSQLGYARQRLIAEAGQTQPRPPNNGFAPPSQQQADAPDPTAVRYSEIFLERHPWFDPTATTDEDSLMAKAIDVALSNEGYRPNTRMYWTEFERRVKARGLGTDDGGNDVDQEREVPERRAPARTGGGLPPRSGRSSGRQDGGSQRFALTQDMRDALDAEGLLEEKGLTKEKLDYRRRLVTTWRDGFKAAEQARR